MSSLNARGWLRLILINILVSAVTAAIIVRLMTAQAGAGVPAPAPAPSRAPATATVMPATARAIATQPPASTPIPFNPTAAPAAQVTSPAQQAALPAGAVGGVRIANVISPGQRQREVVSIMNEGGDAVNLENWTIQNGRGFSYKLPNITVFKEGFLNIYTTSGSNTPTDIFMRQNDSVWQPGDTITLMKDGQPVSKFTIN